MKYQAIMHLKTKSKVLAIMDTLEQAKTLMDEQGAQFTERSYMGGFPMFVDGFKRLYTIQGKSDVHGIVCSINDKELTAHGL